MLLTLEELQMDRPVRVYGVDGGRVFAGDSIGEALAWWRQFGETDDWMHGGGLQWSGNFMRDLAASVSVPHRRAEKSDSTR